MKVTEDGRKNQSKQRRVDSRAHAQAEEKKKQDWERDMVAQAFITCSNFLLKKESTIFLNTLANGSDV